MGSDAGDTATDFFSTGFNPRSRMGSDEPKAVWDIGLAGFNPRSRMGSDFSDLEIWQPPKHVSIHAPAWGATMSVISLIHLIAVSIHAPAWGATLFLRPDWLRTLKQFQSTLPHGERLLTV